MFNGFFMTKSCNVLKKGLIKMHGSAVGEIYHQSIQLRFAAVLKLLLTSLLLLDRTNARYQIVLLFNFKPSVFFSLLWLFSTIVEKSLLQVNFIITTGVLQRRRNSDLSCNVKNVGFLSDRVKVCVKFFCESDPFHFNIVLICCCQKNLILLRQCGKVMTE